MTGYDSSGEEPSPEFCFRDEAARLTEDRVKGTLINLLMIGNSQRLDVCLLDDPAHLNMAAPLRKRLETELPQDSPAQTAFAASASGDSFEFDGRQNGGVAGESECRQVLALQVKADCLANVRRQFVKSLCLSDDGEIEALGDELTIPFADPHLSDSLHFASRDPFVCSMHQTEPECSQRWAGCVSSRPAAPALLRRLNGIERISRPYVQDAFADCRSGVDLGVEFVDRQNLPIAGRAQYHHFALFAGGVHLAVGADR